VKVVVDSNIIFSALLSKCSPIRDSLFLREHKYYAPNFFFSEIFKYKEKILKCSKLDEAELYELLMRLLDGIQFVKSSIISAENRKYAYDLCEDIDEKDVPFIALAIELDAYVWTGDKKLIKGLQRKGFSRFLQP